MFYISQTKRVSLSEYKANSFIEFFSWDEKMPSFVDIKNYYQWEKYQFITLIYDPVYQWSLDINVLIVEVLDMKVEWKI